MAGGENDLLPSHPHPREKVGEDEVRVVQLLSRYYSHLVFLRRQLLRAFEAVSLSLGK